MSSFLARGRARVGGAFVAVAAVAVALGSGAVGSGAAAAPAPGTSDHSGPVINSNFADPDILAGRQRLPRLRDQLRRPEHPAPESTDLVHWTKQPDAAPTLGAWVATTCTFTPGGATDRCVWAPEVTQVRQHATSSTTPPGTRRRASSASASRLDLAERAVRAGEPTRRWSAPPTQGGAIDPSTYTENGQHYLLWKADGNCCNLPAIIYLQPLSADGLTLTGPAQPS